MKNVFKDTLFANFLYSSELDVDINALINECYDLKNTTEGAQKSNKNGWQSKTSKDQEIKNLELLNLKNKSLEFVQVVNDAEKLNHIFTEAVSWVNINQPNSYNMPHTHPGAVLCGCFYMQVPENSGELSFLRNDASSGSMTFANKPSEASFTVSPSVGRLYVFPPWLMHLVSLNESDQDRISIAFNFLVE
jgi:uncharacterized protein (TIGR02466 family)